jgi:hypothetical protein
MLGSIVGCSEGYFECMLDGPSVGRVDGTCVGMCELAKLGVALGSTLGLWLGNFEWTNVGESLGL